MSVLLLFYYLKGSLADLLILTQLTVSLGTEFEASDIKDSIFLLFTDRLVLWQFFFETMDKYKNKI